jgi:hypothetical protein
MKYLDIVISAASAPVSMAVTQQTCDIRQDQIIFVEFNNCGSQTDVVRLSELVGQKTSVPRTIIWAFLIRSNGQSLLFDLNFT